MHRSIKINSRHIQKAEMVVALGDFALNTRQHKLLHCKFIDVFQDCLGLLALPIVLVIHLKSSESYWGYC